MNTPTLDHATQISAIADALGLPRDASAESIIHHATQWRAKAAEEARIKRCQEDAIKTGSAEYLARHFALAVEALGEPSLTPAGLPAYLRTLVSNLKGLSDWQNRLLSENATLHKAHAHNAIDRLLSALKAPLRYDGGEPLTREERIEWAIRRAPKT